ncbi:MAG: LacI family transcriptional regulator [Oscillospiraceae bacterium]|nr:LacI family transcriptional regulator [Oscillospiraceae bacterium]
MERVTIRDVAKASNVSITTVSKALNGYPDVSEATKEKVLKAAKALNYVPNASARSLGGIPEKTIALLMSSLKQRDESGYIYELISSIYNTCNKKGYEFILLATDSLRQKEMTFLELCRHKNLDGAVVMGLNMNDAYYEELKQSPIPCALMDMDIVGENICLVSTNNKDASCEAVTYLLQTGRKEIAILNGKRTAKVSEERFSGYKEALEANGIPLNPEYIVHTDFSAQDALERAKELLIRHRKIDAIFCASDLIAFGALTAASELNIKVPVPLSIIGFDDIFTARYAFGGLTTVHQNYYKIGVKAAECVINMVEKKYAPRRILVNHELLVRSTTLHF